MILTLLKEWGLVVNADNSGRSNDEYFNVGILWRENSWILSKPPKFIIDRLGRSEIHM